MGRRWFIAILGLCVLTQTLAVSRVKDEVKELEREAEVKLLITHSDFYINYSEREKMSAEIA